jgi:hypothetical protein
VAAPEDALARLAGLLRTDDSVITPHICEPADPRGGGLGLLAAAGPRTAADPGEYALVVEAVREGYLLHYGAADARVVRGAEPDLALLAGDYLYALGLERLASIGDLAAVRELSDLISLAAQIHDGRRPPREAGEDAAALWLGAAVAIGAGSGAAHERAKDAVRASDPAAADLLWAAAQAATATKAFRQALGDAAAGLDFRVDQLSSLG